MSLSWNEIKERAFNFSKDYANATRENAETHSFYNDFFHIFGISRRRIASFEEPVKKLGDKKGRIDLFWKGTLLVEQKSAGLNLIKAKEQALDYFPYLKEYELPKYILVSDFKNFELYDLEENTEIKFPLSQLHDYVSYFSFIAGYKKRIFEDQEPVNIEAAELMGELHDKMVENGFTGIELERFLIRLLFCLFADDTGVFEKDIFKFYIEEKTQEDGSDLGEKLQALFQVLNISPEKRFKNLDEDLKQFPYVNGDLYDGYLPITSFDSDMRRQLLKCCAFDWSRISPAIFGAMFQSATDQQKRRDLGAHYTSEQNILKVIKPLFLDALDTEFHKIKRSKNRLQEFHHKIAHLKFLDPACGCGNFLIIAYRELRTLEIEVIKALYDNKQMELDINILAKVNIHQFYGIEIEELPSKIAEVAMWLVDHQMNMKLSETFGRYYTRIPLTSHANILCKNALSLEWKDIIQPTELHYILGNPPFRGSKYCSLSQRQEMSVIFHGVKGAGVLDYVTAWYLKTASYIQKTKIKVAFVSTNSITQGEQVGILWNELFHHYKIKIHFAHRTFSWTNEAKGKAAVFCVIIGFACFDVEEKFIYDYENPKESDPKELAVHNINGYLEDENGISILKRNKPFCDVPKMLFGNMPNDNKNFLLNLEQKNKLISEIPEISKYIKPFIGAKEFLNNKQKFCIWLKGVAPHKILEISKLKEIISNVKEYRIKSDRLVTKKLAESPFLFGEIRQPNTKYLLIPRATSGKRKYIPIDFFEPENIVGDTCLFIADATLYHFGILISLMHNDWMRYTAGRIKGDYRYSNDIVYNNFPFPKNPSEKQINTIEKKAQNILDVRKLYPETSLADLYNPLTMPQDLLEAHHDLDKTVDIAYGKSHFKNERERMEFLFALYQDYEQNYMTPLLPQEKKKRKNKI